MSEMASVETFDPRFPRAKMPNLQGQGLKSSETCIDTVIKYREYIVRAADHHLSSLTDLADSAADDHILQLVVDGFFKEASKYSAGLMGIERFSKLLKVGRKLD